MTVLVSTHYMDEAERCHEIAYIAYGELLAQGTVEEVVEKSHLRTWNVSGPDLQSLSEKLLGMPGIDMVAPFGTSLHVSGRDAQALDAAVARFRDDSQLIWSVSEPTLEDVFIDLMSRSQDNFQ
jgi:ABC-2 type transport system ATP-binding protein